MAKRFRSQNKQEVITPASLKTPRAAAIAGIIFAVLMAAAIVIVRLSVDPNLAEAGTWLVEGGRRTGAVIGVTLLPFAGIAFLWFTGVIRDQLGQREDRFFATILIGSSLVYVALIFVVSAVGTGLFSMFNRAPFTAAEVETWTLGYHITTALSDVAIRIAAVFMVSASTIGVRTTIINRWLAFMGFVFALVLLFFPGSLGYVYLLMPLWVFLVSTEMLIRNLREARGSIASLQEG